MSEPAPVGPVPLAQKRLAEIQAALEAVPAPPWRWIGTRHGGGPQLVTDHSGRQYILSAAKPADCRGDELLDPNNDEPIYGDLRFRDSRPKEQWSVMRPGAELAVGRTDYDPDTIVDVDNHVARWMRDSPAFAADLLAEVDRLRAENAELRTQLVTAERQCADLDRRLGEVEHLLPALGDDVAGVPA